MQESDRLLGDWGTTVMEEGGLGLISIGRSNSTKRQKRQNDKKDKKAKKKQNYKKVKKTEEGRGPGLI